MKNILVIFSLLLPSALIADQFVVQLSQTEGLLITSPGPITVERVPIQQISGVIIPGPGPIDPNLPSGLTAFTKAAVTATVQSYANRDRDSVRLSQVYSVVVGLIDDKKITTSKQADAALKQAVDSVLMFSFAGDKWDNWRKTIAGQLNAMSLQNLEGVRSAYSQIAAGLSQDQITAFAATAAGTKIEGEITAKDILEAQFYDSSEAWGDGTFLKWLLEFLIPLILQLLKVGT